MSRHPILLLTKEGASSITIVAPLKGGNNLPRGAGEGWGGGGQMPNPLNKTMTCD